MPHDTPLMRVSWGSRALECYDERSARWYGFDVSVEPVTSVERSCHEQRLMSGHRTVPSSYLSLQLILMIQVMPRVSGCNFISRACVLHELVVGKVDSMREVHLPILRARSNCLWLVSSNFKVEQLCWSVAMLIFCLQGKLVIFMSIKYLVLWRIGRILEII